MNVLHLDYYAGYAPAAFAKFGSNTSCFDFDLVVWDPKHVIHSGQYTFGGGWGLEQTYRGLPNLDEASSVRLQADIARRRNEFREFVEAGRTLVVITRPPQRFFHDSGRRTHSGTGKNQRTTVHVEEDDVWRALPIDVVLTPAAGKNLQFVGPAAYGGFWREFKDLLGYEAVISGGGNLLPAFKVAGTDKIAGGTYTTKAGGMIIFLPAPDLPPDDDIEEDEDLEEESDVSDARLSDENGEEEEQPVAFRFQLAIEELVTSLAGTDAEPLPEWARAYTLGGESSLRSAVVDKERQIEALRAELAALQADVAKVEGRKRLVTGTGRALELEVRNALEALGGLVSEPTPGRDDWRVKFPEGDAVVEVKGLTKSAGEKDAAQLEKWVANYLEETGQEAKGILIANGWREMPLDKRSAPVFPDQMLKYSKARKHSLITGLQLLGIWQQVEAHPEKAEAWRKKLLATSGVLKGFEDWRAILGQPADEVRVDVEETEP